MKKVMKCKDCGSDNISITTLTSDCGHVEHENKVCNTCESQNISDKPQLLVIELDDINSIPRVFHNGEEITKKIHVKFEWDTKTDVITFNNPVIEIEHAAVKEKKHYTKQIAYNSPFKKEE